MFKEANLENFNKWVKELDTEKPVPMSEEVAYLMMNLILGSDISKEGRQSFLFRLINKRVEVMHSYILEDKAALMISAVCKSPGEAVMYCNYLQWKSDERHLPVITINDICMNIFPFGFFSHESLEKAWTNQKIGGANMLDMIKFK